MPHVDANGIRIAYERSGPEDGTPLLLIHGVGAQLVRWPAGLVAGLEAAGFAVIRFDNRDIGLSTHMDALGLPDVPAIVAARARGEEPALPYSLADMAADTIGLLNALGIARAHVVGVSLGGMIAQQVAITSPERLLSMTIIMSQAGNPATPGSRPEALAALTTPAPDPAIDREAFLRHAVMLNRTVGSPAYPVPEAQIRAFAEAAAARSHNPAGAARQLAAGRGAPDRRAALARLDIPTLVIHGADDPLIPIAGGEDVARAVPRAWMLGIQGMGHDLPEPLHDLIVANIAANARRVTAPARD